MSRYRISADAREDLDRIWDFITARSSAETATKFLWRFYETFQSLGSSPAAGILIPDFKPEGTRKFPMGNYIIYYRPGTDGKILVSRVLHGKRLQKRAFSRAR